MSSEASPSLEIEFRNELCEAGEEENSSQQVLERKIQEIYALAYVLYSHQKYSEASHFFRLLTLISPWVAKFWKGFGASFQMQKDYREALECYLFCSQLTSPDQPDPYLHVQEADCYFALKEIDSGLKALEAAHLSAKKVNDIGVLQHVAFMRQLWSQSSS